MRGQLDAFELLDARQFQITTRRLADSLSYGTDHSHFLGSGIEYVQSRPYQPGDPVRSIDWRVTARTGRFHVKEFESPKRIPVYLLVDTSASMTVSSVRHSKYRTAVLVAGGLALAGLDRVSPVGVIGVGDRGLHVRPTLSKQRILEWTLRLREYRYDEETRLADKIAEITPSLTERVLMIVLSDLHDDGALSALKRVNQLHDCAVIQLQDPAELGTPGAGVLRAAEAETGRDVVVRASRSHVDQETITAELRRGGIDHMVLRTDRPYVHALRRFIEDRGLLSRGAR